MSYRFKIQLLSAGSALNLRSTELGEGYLVKCREVTFYIVFSAGCSAGAVQIESAHVTGYTGTWAPEGSPVAWAAASRVHKVAITGVNLIMSARISTAIVGGTVDIWAVGN